MLLLKAIVIAILPTVTSAQQGIYQQCGGIGWNGPTSCSSGLACSTINSWYFQCLGASSAATTLTTSTQPGSTSVTTTTPPSSSTTSSVASTTPTTSGTIGRAGNPFVSKQIYANPYYASEISNIAVPSLTAASLQAKASAVADVGSFVWLDTKAKVALLLEYLRDIQAKNEAGADPPIIGAFVIYDLPDRDCAADASNGEFSIAEDGVRNYQDYILEIANITATAHNVNIVYIIEPDSLANLVTNMGVPKCANAASAYKQCITYAIQRLNLPNVAMYLDAGHAGWLGWPANIQPAANLFGSLYQAAGSPVAVRGLATNVANYNAWSIATCPSYTSPNANCDEKRYINAMAPLLTAAGFPAHFVTDTSRNGVQPTQQQAWGDWCNVNGTGFGVRPTTDTGDPLEDAFLWIKPGGESDGTSNATAARYDPHCGLSDALQPAPEAGTWFQAYFQQLLVNANPSF